MLNGKCGNGTIDGGIEEWFIFNFDQVCSMENNRHINEPKLSFLLLKIFPFFKKRRKEK